MTDKELSIVLREMARAQKTPLCDEWYGQWKDVTDVDTLLDKYVKGLDFCIENDYPSLEFIRANFNKEDLHRHNIYIDEAVDIVADNGTYVFLGNCTGYMQASGFVVASLYIRHNSSIDLIALDFSKIFASIYDKGELKYTQQESAAVKVYEKA